MRVILFQPQFANQVEARIKRQTIRQRARCKEGDELSLRKWSDRPYASKQQKLGDSEICKSVHPVTISLASGGDGNPDSLQIRVDGQIVQDADAFARADGFHSAAIMREWFESTHGLPFSGELITW